MRVFLFLVCLASFEVHAGDLTIPFELENAGVLPAGIRSPRLKNVFTWVQEKFDGQGYAFALGKPLNHTVTWDEAVNSQDGETRKKLALGNLKALREKGYDLGVGPGDTTGEINTAVNVTVPVFSIGISDRHTLAVAVPVYTVNLSAAASFTKSAGGELFARGGEPDASGNSGVTEGKSQEIAEAINNGVGGKLRKAGYEPLQSETFSAIGDVRLVDKYQIPISEVDELALKSELVLPTGRAPNVDKIVDIATGDGQVDLGATLMWDHKLPRGFHTNAYAGYIIQMPDHLTRRIPTKAGDPISSDKEFLERDPGDVSILGASIGYGSATSGLSVGVGYTFQTLANTTYKGSQYDSARYGYLAQMSPWQQVQSATVSVGYATIDDYRGGKFAVPLQTYFGYGHPLNGINAPAADVYSAELVMFF